MANPSRKNDLSSPEPSLRSEVTQVLAAIQNGHPSAAEDLLPLVYDELRRLAGSRLAAEPHGGAGYTLQPTALVHEAYMRLISDAEMRWESRGHFFAAAAEAMRRILVERARQKRSEKHGGKRQRVPLGEIAQQTEPEPDEMMAIDEALNRLHATDKRLSDVVMLRYFGGLSIQQTAEAMNLAPATVKRDWTYARAWLFEQMNSDM